MVKAFKGKPVKFIAVAANMTPVEVRSYQAETGLAMPVFVDTMGLLQARHGFKISLKNIWQIRVIDADGNLAWSGIELKPEPIEKVLSASSPSRTYADLELDDKLAPVVELLEYRQYGPAAKQLAVHRKSASKSVQESVGKLQTALKKEGTAWTKEAKEAAASDPLKAYDLYKRVATVLPADELGKEAQKSLSALAKEPAVKNELSARLAYQKVTSAMGFATAVQRPAALKALNDFMKKHPNAQVSERAKVLAEELANSPGGP